MNEEPIEEAVKLEPDTFAVTIGNYTHHAWKLVWEKTHLAYTIFDAEYEPRIEEKIVPEEEAWDRFWMVLDQVDAWNWDPYYFANVDEGEATLWTVEVLLKDGRHLDTGGSSSFPGLAEARAHEASSGRGGRRRSGRGGRGGGSSSSNEPRTAPSETEDASKNVRQNTLPFDEFLNAVRALIGGREFFPIDPSEVQGKLPQEEIDRLAPPPPRPKSDPRRRSGARAKSDPGHRGGPARRGRGRSSASSRAKSSGEHARDHEGSRRSTAGGDSREPREESIERTRGPRRRRQRSKPGEGRASPAKKHASTESSQKSGTGPRTSESEKRTPSRSDGGQRRGRKGRRGRRRPAPQSSESASPQRSSEGEGNAETERQRSGTGENRDQQGRRRRRGRRGGRRRGDQPKPKSDS